jgi:hypothetical protein
MSTEPQALDMRGFLARNWWIVAVAMIVAVVASYLRHPATAAAKFTASAYVRVQYPATYTSLPNPDRFVAIVQSPEVAERVALGLAKPATPMPESAVARPAGMAARSLSALVAPGDARLVIVKATAPTAELARRVAGLAAEAAIGVGGRPVAPQIAELQSAIAQADASTAQMKADLKKAEKAAATGGLPGLDIASGVTTLRVQTNQAISLIAFQKATALNQLEQLQAGLVVDRATTVSRSSITGGREKSLAQGAVIGLALGLALALLRELLWRRPAAAG